MSSVAFGQTGLTVSRLSFGTAYLGPLGEKLPPEAGGELLARAFALRVTFWDTSDDYGTLPHIAAALRQVPREQVVIASKTYEPQGAVERALRELETDYLDIMLIHCVGSSWIEPAREALAVLERDKERGLLRAVGFSTHSAEVARRAAEWPEVEVLLGIVNPTGAWAEGEHVEDGTIAEMLEGLERAYAAGKGVYAMKVLGAGALASDPAEAIRFAARLPYVHSLCIGMRDLDEVQQNLALLEGHEP
jgi:aryl-alcohol dehydrogenase-like predicted oxidoreductase